jgi:Rod binding domain-containing protein
VEVGRRSSDEKGTDPALARLAREFESVFVRQLLEESHALTAGAGAGQAGMLIDAVSSAIASAGGLGLAAGIEHELSRGAALKLPRNEP